MKSDVENQHSPELQEALNLLGKLLNIAAIYGMDHPSVLGPLQETHRALEAALSDSGRLSLGLFNQTLTVNDKMVSEYTVHLRALERKLVSLNIPNLNIQQGLSEDELHQLVSTLCTAGARAGQSLKEKLSESGLAHIKTEEVEYVARHEGEYLIGEEEGLGGEGEGAEGAGEGGEGAGEGGGQPDAPPAVQVEQIVAFIKGETSSSETPSDDLQQLLSDPEKLGQLIMEAAAIRQSAQSLDNSESLADIVIGCLRRTYEDLRQQKAFKSSRGQASLNKAMLLLEKTVADKIRSTVGENLPDMDDQILSELREMEEERRAGILATRYAEQCKKLSKSEKDVGKYIRGHGEEAARKLFSAAEISDKEWRRLVVQARGDGETGSGRGEGSGESIDMSALAIVLDKLENIMQLGEAPPEEMRAAVDAARTGIQNATAEFTQQIEKLEARIERFETEGGDTLENQAGKMSRGDLLLEISQLALKLSQPLTVITVSIDAALQQVSQPDLQKELLELAQESGLTMKEFMKRLTTLVGYPTLQEADIGYSE